jgi:hypothetical protein
VATHLEQSRTRIDYWIELVRWNITYQALDVDQDRFTGLRGVGHHLNTNFNGLPILSSIKEESVFKGSLSGSATQTAFAARN